MMTAIQPVFDNDTDLDAEIDRLVQRIREHKVTVEVRNIEIDALKGRLEILLKQKGSNWSDTYGYARLLSEGTRTSYDTEELDRLIITDPLRYGWLKDYRRESTTPPRLQVK
jgi:hypothetical protein